MEERREEGFGREEQRGRGREADERFIKRKVKMV